MQINIDPMAAIRAAAKERIDAHYNHIALQNLHHDHLHHVRRSSGKTKEDHPIEAREAARMALIAAIAIAESPAAVDAAIKAAGL